MIDRSGERALVTESLFDIEARVRTPDSQCRGSLNFSRFSASAGTNVVRMVWYIRYIKKIICLYGIVV